MSFLLRVCLTAGAAMASYGQSIFVGAIASGRATDDLNGDLGGATSQSKQYLVGPSIEVGLPLGFAIEVNTLYRREGYQTAFGNFAYNVFSVEWANSWEFPLLAKYCLPVRAVRAFGLASAVPYTHWNNAAISGFGDGPLLGVLAEPVGCAGGSRRPPSLLTANS